MPDRPINPQAPDAGTAHWISNAVGSGLGFIGHAVGKIGNAVAGGPPANPAGARLGQALGNAGIKPFSGAPPKGAVHNGMQPASGTAKIRPSMSVAQQRK